MAKSLAFLEKQINSLEGAYLNINLTSQSDYFKEIKKSIGNVDFSQIF